MVRRVPPAGRRVAPLLAACGILVAAAPCATQQPQQSTPAPVTLREFQSLGWLAGDWLGHLPEGGFFYERYRLVDDSTFVVESFADGSFSAPEDLGRIALRGGVVYREEPTGERIPVTRVDHTGILFGTVSRGFTWSPRGDGAWTATIHGSEDGGAGEVVYLLEQFSQVAQDRAAVHAAVLDYVEALYRVDPSRIERSVHPEMAKRGFWRPGGSAEYRVSEMNYEELRELAADWNRQGRVDAATAVKEIVVYDVLDVTATAKLTADWGTDYLHLGKYDGRWKIVNVLWQSPPPSPSP